jgi:hypothetical protein
MSGRHLVLCNGCGRHVRAMETACPFCHTGLSGSAPEPAQPTGRLSRAALVAFGLTVAGAACSNHSQPNNGGTIPQGGVTSSGGEGASTGYGVDGDRGAPVSSEDGGTASDASTPTPPADAAIGVMYGAPVARYGAPSWIPPIR